VGRTLRQIGVPDTVVVRALAEAYRLSAAVDSVQVGSSFVDVFPRSWKVVRYYRASIPSAGDWKPPKSHVTLPEEQMLELLKKWARILDDGHLLLMDHIGSMTIVPRGRDAEDTDRALGSLQAGRKLSPADSAALLRVVPASEWAADARLERLERIRP
jgi:hypothetical protein